MNKTLALNCVGERKVAYRAKKELAGVIGD